MKRIITVLLFISLLSVVALSAEERTLIDFATLTADTTLGSSQHHGATTIQFSDRAASMNLSEEARKEMVVSMSLDQWEIEFASSSRTVANMSKSTTKQVASKAYKQVLGARIHFPTGYYNSWAIVKPPFEIPAYAEPTKIANGVVVPLTAEEMQQANASLTVNDEGYVTSDSKFDGYGVIKNVGVIKSVSASVYGNNFPHGFGIRLKNEREEIRDIFIGYLNFDGWKTLTWSNPNYIEDVRDRELAKVPLYPYATPHIKFMGLIVYRDGSKIGDDFVVYFKDVKVSYDKAILTTDRDIQDEETWKILYERESLRKQTEEAKVGDIQMLRYLEEQKMHKETSAAATTASTATTTSTTN